MIIELSKKTDWGKDLLRVILNSPYIELIELRNRKFLFVELQRSSSGGKYESL